MRRVFTVIIKEKDVATALSHQKRLGDRRQMCENIQHSVYTFITDKVVFLNIFKTSFITADMLSCNFLLLHIESTRC